ncbi:FtsK/SpoIIIE domain-containing protein [Saccharopolyspora sp. NPDC050642]|uniref:caspase, EACC1-associated type n=1 Tax=Saccharopolyspora sp. NPDC050642 TaxID=3157099 RepID=UPI0033F330F4
MGRRTALLIATSMYGDPGLRQLRAPAGEAEELQQVLLSQGGFDQVEVLRNESKRQIERGIEEAFQEAGPDDLVLLYLSCHGIKNDRGQLLFAACNTELDRIESSAVGSVFVQHQLSASQAGTKVVLLDCCYSGAFSHGLVPKSAEGIDLRQLVGRGTYIMTATSAVEYAYEGNELTSSDPVPSSLFTRAVLKGIRTGAADIDGDGLITGDELYNYVFRELDGQRQTPSRETRMAGDFFIARTASAQIRRPKPAPTGPVALGPLRAELPGTNLPAGSTLNVPVGTGANRKPFLLSLAGPENHLAVIGPAQSGKSQFLRTLVLALALDSDPAEVRFYLVDSESRFGAFARLPHVGAVLGPDQHSEVEQLVYAAERKITARRAMFRDAAIETLEAFRAARRNRELPRDADHQDVFLVIDRWEAFADENPGLVARVERIADQGTSFGVHLVVAARFWSKIPDAIRQHLRGHVEFTPGSPEASSHAGPFRAALPAPGGAEPHAQHRGILALVSEIADREEPADPLLHPLQVPRTDSDPASAWRRRTAPDWLRLPIGRDVFGRTVHLDLNPDGGSHGLIIGQHGAGARETLRSLVFLLASTHSPDDVNLVLLAGSPAGPFHDLAGLPHVAMYAEGPLVASSGMVPELRAVRREIARRRGAETRPELFVFIHNFAETASYQPGAAGQLLEIMTSGAEVGVHVILLARDDVAGRFPEIDELCRFRIDHGTDPEAGAGSLKQAGAWPIRFRAWEPPGEGWHEQTARISSAVPERAAELRSPLADPIALADVLGRVVPAERGLSAESHERCAEVPIGLVEVVETGDAEPLTVPFGGNIAIRGDPFTGKSAVTRTIVLATALTHTPEEVGFHFICLGDGHACGDALSELPHVGSVAKARDEELAAAIVAHLQELVETRRADPPGTFLPVYLVVEQWSFLADLLPGLVVGVRKLIRDGADRGVHVIVSADRWLEEDRDWLARCPTHLELGGTQEAAGTVGGREFRAAEPRMHPDLEPAVKSTRALARRIADEWRGSPALGVSLPPAAVAHREIENLASPHLVLGRVTGVERWAELDLAEHPHLLCLGERGSGKTNLVRLAIAEIKRLYAADECDIIVLDPKRGLLGEADGPQFGYAAVRGEFERILAEMAFRIEQRLSRPRSGAERPREVFLIIEDCELISADPRSGRPDPLQRYADHLVRGGEVGVHLIVSRNSVNIGDALTTRFLGKLRAADCATVVLGGDPRDGELLPGVASMPRPPGRGRFVRGMRNDMIQVAEMPPSA